MFKVGRQKSVNNPIGSRPGHIAHAKDLFRPIVKASLQKEWICQAAINFADDGELLTPAANVGCGCVFIGFESLDPGGLLKSGREFS